MELRNLLHNILACFLFIFIFLPLGIIYRIYLEIYQLITNKQ